MNKTEDWVIWSLGDCTDSDNTLADLANAFKEYQIPIESVTECFSNPNIHNLEPGRIAKMWQQVVGVPIIPFNQKKHQKAIDKLGKQFDRHLAEWNHDKSL